MTVFPHYIKSVSLFYCRVARKKKDQNLPIELNFGELNAKEHDDSGYGNG